MGTNSIVEQSDGRPDLANDDLRARLDGMWASVAGGWREYAEYVDARGSAVTERMIELSSLRPNDRVLELACGPGSVGLAAAERVGPAGQVVVSDVAAEMTAIAIDRAHTRGLANVTVRVLDLESIDEPDGTYDVVLCREGLMFASDPARGVREIARVLRPGGGAALAVWGPRERNPWLGLVFDAVSAELEGRSHRPERRDPSRSPMPVDSSRSGQTLACLTSRSASCPFRSVPPRSTNGGTRRAPSPAR